MVIDIVVMLIVIVGLMTTSNECCSRVEHIAGVLSRKRVHMIGADPCSIDTERRDADDADDAKTCTHDHSVSLQYRYRTTVVRANTPAKANPFAPCEWVGLRTCPH